LEFLNSEPYYASKKTVNQSSDFPVRRTGLYRHKKALTTPLIFYRLDALPATQPIVSKH